MMTENFAELFEHSQFNESINPGELLNATVVGVIPDEKRVIVDIGLKSESVLPTTEFEKLPEIGDQVDVVIKSIANFSGETVVSHVDAKRVRDWSNLEEKHNNSETVIGLIMERVKGGFTVELGAVKAFLPGSLVDVKPVRDPGFLEGKEFEFKIIKMDYRRNNVVVSRRAVMEEENGAERNARLDELKEGDEIAGVVKNITDYGAFVDLGGIDGLLHITDIAWKRVKHPSEVLNVHDEIQVKILKFDREKNRVSLGMKQLGGDPWKGLEAAFPSNTRTKGRVSNITDYGCFVEISDGVEGLVHMSEMDWTNKNIHPGKVVELGEEVEVMILDIDETRRRISLGIKQCRTNPWHAFAEKHEVGQKVSGKIRSITDFGAFVGLEGTIDGLVHLSDVSWSGSAEDELRKLSKGDEVEALILAIDAERERISLGIKQLEGDPLADYLESVDKEAVIEAKILSVEAKQVKVELEPNVEGVMRSSDYSYDRIKDLREALKEGETLEVKVVNYDRKTRQIQVSHKVLETPKKELMREAAENAPTNTTLGDLLKEQMHQDEED